MLSMAKAQGIKAGHRISDECRRRGQPWNCKAMRAMAKYGESKHRKAWQRQSTSSQRTAMAKHGKQSDGFAAQTHNFERMMK